MAVYKGIQIDRDETVESLMKKLYQYNEDLKFTLSNLDLEDNFSKSTLNRIDARNEKVRELTFDGNGMKIDFENLKTWTETSITQSKESIKLLVDRGKVVETMLTRMEIYGDSIRLKSGQILIDAQNMKLDAAGNATFSGAINGGSIWLGNGKFWVNANGDCYIDDTLTTETLNPAKGIYAERLEVYNDDEYVIWITKAINANGAYISGKLNCRQVKFHSDARLKRDVKTMLPESCGELVKRLRPKRFAYKASGAESMGFIAQEVDELQRENEIDLPLVDHTEEYLAIPYMNYVAVLVGAVQQNQKKIERIRRGWKSELL